MADDTNQQGAADRGQVAAGEGYEVAYFATKHGITQAAARVLIAEIGNDREKLDAAAQARGAAKPSPRKPRAKVDGSATKKRSSTRGGNTRSRKSAGGAALDTAAALATPALAAVADPVKAGTKGVKRASSKAVKPVIDAVAPAAKGIAERAKAAVGVARRSSASARRRVTAAPAAVGRQAGKALDATKTAATGRTAALLGAAAAGLVTGLAVNIGRKAVVQAPSILAGDWFEALKTEHAMALTIFDQIEKTTDAEPAKRAVLLTQLKHALGKHAFTEENVIYPALRDWGDKADADKLNHDHGYVKQYLYELEALDNSSPAFLARVAAFRADLAAHIREEEDAVFPPLHAALGEAKNAEITALANKEGFKLA